MRENVPAETAMLATLNCGFFKKRFNIVTEPLESLDKDAQLKFTILSQYFHFYILELGTLSLYRRKAIIQFKAGLAVSL